MHIEKQGSSECFLAVIAAISNNPLEVIREYACKEGKVATWNGVMYLSDEKFWKLCLTIGNHFGISYLPKEIESLLTTNIIPNNTVTLQGKGCIIIRNNNGQAPMHILAFEDGTLYDSDNSEPIFNISGFQKHYPTWGIVNISTEPMGD